MYGTGRGLEFYRSRLRPLIFSAVLGVWTGYRLKSHEPNTFIRAFYLQQAAVPQLKTGNRGSRFRENLRQATVDAQWQYWAATVSSFDLFAF
jgi:hypothetical protein